MSGWCGIWISAESCWSTSTAIWLGCARKYVAMLNGQPPMPITSLRYFLGLIEEVSQTNAPDAYWTYVRSKVDQLERQWLQHQSRAVKPLR